VFQALVHLSIENLVSVRIFASLSLSSSLFSPGCAPSAPNKAPKVLRIYLSALQTVLTSSGEGGTKTTAAPAAVRRSRLAMVGRRTAVLLLLYPSCTLPVPRPRRRPALEATARSTATSHHQCLGLLLLQLQRSRQPLLWGQRLECCKCWASFRCRRPGVRERPNIKIREREEGVRCGIEW